MCAASPDSLPASAQTHVNNFSPMQEVKGTASSPPVQFPTAWEVTYVNKWALDGLDLDVGVPANGVTTNVESEQARSDHLHRDIQCVCLPAGKSYGGRRATCGSGTKPGACQGLTRASMTTGPVHPQCLFSVKSPRP